MAFYDSLCHILDPESIVQNESMSRHTTFGVGGPARFFVSPRSEEQIRDVIALCRAEDMPFFILGKGSNLLVADSGFDGVMIHLGRDWSKIVCEGVLITAQSGAALSQIAAAALENGLGGFAFAAGIPGTLGGAVTMNAGAYGGSMSDVLQTVRVLTEDGAFADIPASEMELGYRTSRVGREDLTVLSAVIRLHPEDPEAIRAEMDDLAQRRMDKQPLEFRSAGSTFKRPEGYFAGKLIQDAGLAGYAVGDAEVSAKHCGFVINRGGCTAEDIRQVIAHVQETVFAQFGVRLETEVRFVGEF